MAKRPTKIAGQFISRPRQLVDNPVMNVLSRAAFLVLNRIESEHMAHGGAENGKLPVTYEDFERCGVYADGIAPALRELEALGLIETTRKGYGGAAEVRMPSLYRLTYVAAWDARRTDGTGTHEYLKFQTIEYAEQSAKRARKAIDPRVSARARKHFATPGFRSISPQKTGGETQKSRPRKPGVQPHPRKPGVLSISREGRPRPTPPELTTLLDDVLPSNALTPFVAGPKLVWTEPIVSELFGDERLARWRRSTNDRPRAAFRESVNQGE